MKNNFVNKQFTINPVLLIKCFYQEVVCIATEIIVISDVCSFGSWQIDYTNYKLKGKIIEENVKYNTIFLNSCYICDYMINTFINKVALGKKDKHIFIIYSNSIFSRSKNYSSKTIKYFIKMQKNNKDQFFIYSKNPASLLLGAYIGMIPKIYRRI